VSPPAVLEYGEAHGFRLGDDRVRRVTYLRGDLSGSGLGHFTDPLLTVSARSPGAGASYTAAVAWLAGSSSAVMVRSSTVASASCSVTIDAR
jgi:hypothetical protein